MFVRHFSHSISRRVCTSSSHALESLLTQDSRGLEDHDHGERDHVPELRAARDEGRRPRLKGAKGGAAQDIAP